MKKYIVFALVSALFAVAFSSCRKDEPLSKDSIITMDDYIQNDFDKWLEANFVNPYNIVFKYRYQIDESNRTYYTIPASYDCAIIMAHLVKYLCIDSYDEIAGVNFTRQYFPKMFFIIGEWEYNNNGTYVLGTAEGGRKIWLAGVNHVKENIAKGASQLNSQYLKTIHHEFTHILNQNTPYQVAFKEMTKTTYVADSWSKDPYNKDYRKRGYISSYAQHSPAEDFAELYSIYVTSSAETWQSYLDEAVITTVDENGIKTNDYTYQNILQKKIDLVRAYMEKSWGIDLDLMREVLSRRLNDVVNGYVDLDDLSM